MCWYVKMNLIWIVTNKKTVVILWNFGLIFTHCTLRHGYIKSPNLDLRFGLQSEPYDVKIGPHWLKITQDEVYGDLFYTLKACLYGYSTIKTMFFLVYLVSTQEHTILPDMCQNFAIFNWNRAILVLENSHSWDFCTFYVPLCSKKAQCAVQENFRPSNTISTNPVENRELFCDWLKQ